MKTRGLVLAIALMGARTFASEPVRIALFASTSGDAAPETAMAEEGLRLAIAEANASGTPRFELTVVSADLPWSGAASRLARLVYDEHVSAVVGGLDGRSAHVAEQVVARAKGRLLFVTPWASDPTLIRLPWFARTIPDDRVQAVDLLQEICARRGFRRVAIVQQEGDYDADRAAAAFRAHAPIPLTRVGYRAGESPERTRDALVRARCEAIVLLGAPGPAGRLLAAMRAGGLAAAVYAPLRLESPLFETAAGASAGDVVFVPLATPRLAAFSLRYRARHGHEPWPLSFFAYEAGAELVRAIRESSPDRGSVWFRHPSSSAATHLRLASRAPRN